MLEREEERCNKWSIALRKHPSILGAHPTEKVIIETAKKMDNAVRDFSIIHAGNRHNKLWREPRCEDK